MTTAPTTMLSEADLALIERVHGHLCPMVLLGARTAGTARRHLAASDKGSVPFGFYRGYGCAVDGVQIYSGCTWGNQNLILLRGRDFSLVLTLEGEREGVRVSPLPQLLERIRGERTPESRAALMDLFTSAPDKDILAIETVRDLGVLSEFPGD